MMRKMKGRNTDNNDEPWTDQLLFQMANREEDEVVRRPEVGGGDPGLT